MKGWKMSQIQSTFECKKCGCIFEIRFDYSVPTCPDCGRDPLLDIDDSDDDSLYYEYDMWDDHDKMDVTDTSIDDDLENIM